MILFLSQIIFFSYLYFMKLKEIKNYFLRWITQWAWIVFIMGIVWVVYAATQIETTNPWDVLTSSKMNEIINRINSLEASSSVDFKALPTAWINFDWTNCPSWVCVIRDSYNIESVTNIGIWRYKIKFKTPMDNANYSVTTWFWDYNSGWVGNEALSYVWGNPDKTINEFSLATWDHTTWGAERYEINLQIMWWKNY